MKFGNKNWSQGAYYNIVTVPPGGVVGGGVTVSGGEVPGGLSVASIGRTAMITATTQQMTAPMINHLHQLCPAGGDQGINQYLSCQTSA